MIQFSQDSFSSHPLRQSLIPSLKYRLVFLKKSWLSNKKPSQILNVFVWKFFFRSQKIGLRVYVVHRHSMYIVCTLILKPRVCIQVLKGNFCPPLSYYFHSTCPGHHMCNFSGFSSFRVDCKANLDNHLYKMFIEKLDRN